jgi:hypothetical protein
MSVKKIFSLLLVIFGEFLIALCFLHFGRNLQFDILTLNIVVTSLIFCTLFIDIIFPWVNFKDKSQKEIGSIGLRWFFTFFYLILAVSVMVIFNILNPVHFTTQLIIHGVLFFLLLLGFFMAFSSSDKVKQVYIEEKQNRERIDEMKKVTKELQIMVDAKSGIPSEIVSRINEIQENLRYLSPCNNSNAYELENQFVNEIRNLILCFIDNELNIEKINNKLKNCERTLKERKQIFSN